MVGSILDRHCVFAANNGCITYQAEILCSRPIHLIVDA